MTTIDEAAVVDEERRVACVFIGREPPREERRRHGANGDAEEGEPGEG
jgi:hypothetical protein